MAWVPEEEKMTGVTATVGMFAFWHTWARGREERRRSVCMLLFCCKTTLLWSFLWDKVNR